jgi:hypothetical protein
VDIPALRDEGRLFAFLVREKTLALRLERRNPSMRRSTRGSTVPRRQWNRSVCRSGATGPDYHVRKRVNKHVGHAVNREKSEDSAAWNRGMKDLEDAQKAKGDLQNGHSANDVFSLPESGV